MLPPLLRRAVRFLVAFVVGVLLVLPAVLAGALHGMRYMSYVHDRREDTVAT